MTKKALTEADIRSKFITPALTGAKGEKWDLMTQIAATRAQLKQELQAALSR
jgi:hypothetical protein